MKTKRLFHPFSATLAATAFLAFAHPFSTALLAQGSLTPPGAPEPTMKTLVQVEPRTAIDSLPFTITEPGSYYLTGNATVSGNAIRVQAGGVSIDLNGFTLTGDGGIVDYGVLVDLPKKASGLAVRNGKFVNFGGAVAVGQPGVDDVVVENIQMHTSTRAGIWIAAACSGAVIRNNLLVNCNNSIQIVAFADEVVSGVTIANNRVSDGTGDGIRINAQNGAEVRDISVLNNQVSGTASTAVSVSASPGGSVTRLLIDSNHLARNAGLGILVPASARATVIRNVLTGCTLNVNGTGNTVGPTVSTTGTLGTTGADASPWANLVN